MNQTRNELLREIQRWQFRIIELTLFLDTHPNDQRALADYNQSSQRLRTLVDEYEKRYGPLSNWGLAPSGSPWAWACGPWPWETGI